MDRAKMRSILRRRLQEETADQWDDSDLNELLNVGLQRMQSAIMKVDPLAFVAISTADTVIGATLSNQFYAYPPGFFYELSVELKTSSTSDYAEIERKTHKDVLSASSSSAQDPFYARIGRNFAVAPPLSAAVTAGLRVTFVDTLTMNDDADIPDIPKSLHIGIVLYAHYFTLPESGEGEAQANVLKELSVVLAEIPLVYTSAAGTADALRPDIDKGY